MKTNSTVMVCIAFLGGACWLLNIATAGTADRFSTSSEAGNPLPAPVKLQFTLSEIVDLPDTTNGKLPQGHAIEYVKSAITVDTDGKNTIELKLKDGRKVAFEFSVQNGGEPHDDTERR